ncbi:MAG: hypothetical protein Q9227_001861 [Pyrenula ochraceoflavens]
MTPILWPLFVAANFVLFPSVIHAQFPPKPEGLKVVQSKFHEGVTISYKEPGPICETTPGVKSYSGYVSLPPGQLDEPTESQKYPINTRVYYCREEAEFRKLTAGFIDSSGSLKRAKTRTTHPCRYGFKVALPKDDTLSEFYDTCRYSAVAFCANLVRGGESLSVHPFGLQLVIASTNSLFTVDDNLHPTFGAALTFHIQFPHYKPHNERISLWTESYGGRYGPTFTSYFAHQNALIRNGTLTGPGLHYLHLDTLGIINGCIDAATQERFYAEFAHNNTYGIQVFNDTLYERLMEGITGPGGVEEKIEECRRLTRELDPDMTGNNPVVNEFCIKVWELSWSLTEEPYGQVGTAGRFDVTVSPHHSPTSPSPKNHFPKHISAKKHPSKDPYPPWHFIGLLNQPRIQSALGVPVNFTFYSAAVSSAFDATADFMKGGLLEDIAYVLDQGVRVALVYGDRDWACNWLGGEAASTSIPHPFSKKFTEKGKGEAGDVTYNPIVIDPFTSGGLVRQYANLSFSRIYQAGHMVPAFQPRTAYEIFMRVVRGRDVATGEVVLDDYGYGDGEGVYRTKGGKKEAWSWSDDLGKPGEVCYVLAAGESCEEETWREVREGRAKVEDWVVVGMEGEEEKEEGKGKGSAVGGQGMRSGQEVLGPLD